MGKAQREQELPVCPKCGWHNNYNHKTDCSVTMGDAANALRSLRGLGDIPATKLGYGFGRLTFEIDEDTSITFQFHRDGTFDLERVFYLDKIGVPDAKALVEIFMRMRRKP